MSYQRKPSWLVPLFLAVCTSSCVLSSVSPQEFATYPLDLGTGSATGAAVGWQLAIDEPRAAGPLGSEHIVARETDRAYSLLRGVRWNEPAPELLQSALVRTFEDSGRIGGVARSASGVRGDYCLLVELRAFEADYSRGAPEARIILSAKLVRTEGMQVVATHIFSEREPAQGRSLGAVVGAFDRAGRRAISDLRDWVLEAGEADWRATGG
jgi:cholesterol transport system auxiliary component